MKNSIKPIVTLKSGDTIIPPSGVAADAVTREDLIKYPEKYLSVYRSYYSNAIALEHDLATKSTVSRSGNKIVVNPLKTKSGGTFNILSRKKNVQVGEVQKEELSAVEKYRKLLGK